MANQVHITPEPKIEPNLRKLARALIALAEQELSKETDDIQNSPKVRAVTTQSGDAA